MSAWQIDPSLFESSVSETVRKAREEYTQKLQQAELDMGGPIEIVRTEWRDGKLVTWYKRAPCHD